MSILIMEDNKEAFVCAIITMLKWHTKQAPGPQGSPEPTQAGAGSVKSLPLVQPSPQHPTPLHCGQLCSFVHTIGSVHVSVSMYIKWGGVV